jgi:hypothetical protein
MKRIVIIGFVLLACSFNQLAFAQGNSKTNTKPATAATRKLTEKEKIDHLITYIRNLQGTTFIRNGDEYPAKDAAEHLQMKRRKAGDKVKTARDFIDGLASESYISGKEYQIRMKDGKTYKSRDVLMRELERIEKQK